MTDRDEALQEMLDGVGQPVSHGDDLLVYRQLYDALSQPAPDLLPSFTDHVMQEVMVSDLLREQRISWLPGVFISIAALLIVIPSILIYGQLETSNLDLTGATAMMTQFSAMLSSSIPVLVGLATAAAVVSLETLLKKIPRPSVIPSV